VAQLALSSKETYDYYIFTRFDVLLEDRVDLPDLTGAKPGWIVANPDSTICNDLFYGTNSQLVVEHLVKISDPKFILDHFSFKTAYLNAENIRFTTNSNPFTKHPFANLKFQLLNHDKALTDEPPQNA
jgi:hypothetical protein